MVWKNNFVTNETLTTKEGFLDDFPLSSFKNITDLMRMGLYYLDAKHFPKHFIFANFQCLRCGLCCKNYECVEIESELVTQWEAEGRDDILQYFVVYTRSPNGHILGEIYPRGATGCPLCRKITNKPYYGCKIHDTKDYIPVCKAYLCSKSVPVAHLEFANVDELIDLIGLTGYYTLIERDCEEEFDYSDCWIKTHKKITERAR